MKRIVSLVLMFSFILLSGCTRNYEGTLKIYNWGDYIDKSVIRAFEKEYNIKVVYDEFSTNEDMYAKLKAGGINYDIVIPSEYMVEKMANENMLSKIDHKKLSNYEYIDDNFKTERYNRAKDYSVPYMWGTVGIIYNKDVVKEKVDSFSILWNKKYKKQILMLDSQRDSIGVTLKLLGYSSNSTNDKELGKAREMLIRQKPLILSYVNEEVKDIMIGNEASLAVVWSGDATYMKSQNKSLRYVIPKEGSNMWIDSMVIPKDSKNKDLALKFIDYMLRPDVALKNCEFTGYLTPHKQVKETLENKGKNILEYPTQEELERLEVFKDLGKAISKYDRVWTEVKST